MKWSTLTLQVDEFLNELSKYTKEDDQQAILTQITKRYLMTSSHLIRKLFDITLELNFRNDKISRYVGENFRVVNKSQIPPSFVSCTMGVC